jgi:Tfp pilus assembly protein PilX
MTKISRQLRRAGDDQGFAMLAVIVVMFVGGLFIAAALASADSDQPSSRHAQDRKAAYAAAEAGIEYYKFHLAQDNDYWNRCTNVPAPSALNDEWDPKTTPADTRTNWRTVPGTTGPGTAEYAVELLPASGTKCVASDGGKSMLAPDGTFRIRSTGRVNGVKRSIVTTFRRPNFLDYLYFTDFEDLDWKVGNDSDQCEAYRPSRAGKGCTEISFGGGDKVLGPLHTNDSIQVSGTVTFGSSSNDAIEISLDKPKSVNGSGTITWTGTLNSPIDPLPMPDNNGELDVPARTPQGIMLDGLNTVELDSSTTPAQIKIWKGMRPDQTYTTWSNGSFKADKPPTVTKPWPDNGVLYVQGGSGGCSSTDSPHNADYFDDSTGCPELFLSGSYKDNLTVGSAGDIVVAPRKWKEGDATNSTSAGITRTGDAVLGLIANNYVRVWHPVSSCTNRSPAQTDVTIQAAILALRSFIVDNWDCRPALGKLSVDGAIAQKFRGPVATGGSVSAPSTGYIKNYTYDRRLKYRSPPYFLKPVNAAWKVLTQHEQTPAS